MVFKRKYREKIIPYILSKYCVKKSLQITVGKGCDRREHRTPLYKSTQGYATTPLYREMSGILIYRFGVSLEIIFEKGFQKGMSRENISADSIKLIVFLSRRLLSTIHLLVLLIALYIPPQTVSQHEQHLPLYELGLRSFGQFRL